MKRGKCALGDKDKLLKGTGAKQVFVVSQDGPGSFGDVLVQAAHDLGIWGGLQEQGIADRAEDISRNVVVAAFHAIHIAERSPDAVTLALENDYFMDWGSTQNQAQFEWHIEPRNQRLILLILIAIPFQIRQVVNAENAILDEFDESLETVRARLLGDDFRDKAMRHAPSNDFNERSVIAGVKRKINEYELGL